MLESDAGLSANELLREVAMPVREIDEAVANLKRKGLVNDDDSRVRLTTAGIEQTDDLWSIAQEQQDKVFADFSDEQIETFKAVLKTLIRQC
ncbi:p-hydroxyphenylacetate 3-hydroxylase, reductase component [compost metagenome]